MTDIDLSRFAALADAYGGAIARWPAEEREAAHALATRPEAAHLLARADRLDAALDGWALAAPSRALIDRIAASAPRDTIRSLRLWWSGFAGLALAGAAAGALAVAALPPLPGGGDEAGYADTAFGGWGADG